MLAMASFIVLVALSRGFNTTVVDPADAVNVPLLLFVLMAGIINGATLVIPGLSGAFILLVLGLYPLIIYSVSSIAVFLADISNFSLLRDICLILLPYGIGGFIGCLGMARIMEKLMRNFCKAVYAVILGLLLGSLFTLLRNPLVSQGVTSPASLIVGVITFCAGAAAAYLLGKKQEP
jgi:putative membrane protein